LILLESTKKEQVLATFDKKLGKLFRFTLVFDEISFLALFNNLSSVVQKQ